MDWQSIYTAPKDGQDIIVLSDNGIRVAHWSEGGLFTDWFIPLDGTICSGGIYAKRATHWMPLPAPPVAHTMTELPNDWFVEHDGQRLVLDPEKVRAAFDHNERTIRACNQKIGELERFGIRITANGSPP